jgi:hypothetical protein
VGRQDSKEDGHFCLLLEVRSSNASDCLAREIAERKIGNDSYVVGNVAPLRCSNVTI